MKTKIQGWIEGSLLVYYYEYYAQELISQQL